MYVHLHERVCIYTYTRSYHVCVHIQIFLDKKASIDLFQVVFTQGWVNFPQDLLQDVGCDVAIAWKRLYKN